MINAIKRWNNALSKYNCELVDIKHRMQNMVLSNTIENTKFTCTHEWHIRLSHLNKDHKNYKSHEGHGIIDLLKNLLESETGIDVSINEYHEDSIHDVFIFKTIETRS